MPRHVRKRVAFPVVSSTASSAWWQRIRCGPAAPTQQVEVQGPWVAFIASLVSSLGSVTRDSRPTKPPSGKPAPSARGTHLPLVAAAGQHSGSEKAGYVSHGAPARLGALKRMLSRSPEAERTRTFQAPGRPSSQAAQGRNGRR